MKKASFDGVPYPAALRATVDNTDKQEPKESPPEQVSEVVAEETSTNGGEE